MERTYLNPVNIVQPVIFNFRFLIPVIVTILIEMSLFELFAHIEWSYLDIVFNFANTLLATFDVTVIQIVPAIYIYSD